MSNAVLISVAVLTVLLAPWWRAAERPAQRARALRNAGLALVALALGAFAIAHPGGTGPWWAPLGAFLIGVGASLAGFDAEDSDRPSALALPLGAAALLEWAISRPPQASLVLSAAFFAGTGAGAALLAVQGCGRAARDLALVGALVLAVNALTPASNGQPVLMAQVVVLAALAALAADELSRLATSGKGWPRFVTALLFGAVVGLLVSRALGAPETGVLAAASSAIAVVVSWSLGGHSRSGPGLVGSLVWVALATVAFAMAQSVGIAVVALSACCALLLVGDRSALLWAAPIFALALMRLGRSKFPDLAHGLDIGQHYALIGLVSGLLLPGAADEAAQPLLVAQPLRRMAGVGLLGLEVLTLLYGLTSYLGQKGAGGLIVGCALSALVPRRSARPSWGGAAYGVSMGLAVLAVTGTLASLDPLERSGKLGLGAWTAGLVLVCGLGVWALARTKKSREVAA